MEHWQKLASAVSRSCKESINILYFIFYFIHFQVILYDIHIFSMLFSSSSSSSNSFIIHLFFFFMVSVMSLSAPVVYAIVVVDNLGVEVTLVEEGIVVELVEMGKGFGGNATFMFMGMNLHSYC